jgi:UDP-glucose 4-epimerase
VYGRGTATPSPETAPLTPISSYGYGKLAAEEALRFLGRAAGLRVAVLRAANPVGRWQTNLAHGVISVAIRAARAGEPITLFGGGHQVRDFFDADDLALAIIRAADDTSYDIGTWNVGSGIGTRVIDVVKMVEETVGQPIAINHHPKRTIDVEYAVLDCTLAREQLGWTAQTPLFQSIRRLVANS